MIDLFFLFFEVQRVNFTIWDVGGCDKIRPLWRHYFQNTNLVVFVIDSNDNQRLSEAWSIYLMTEEEVIKQVPVVFLANKQDLPNSQSTKQLWDQLGLSKIQHRHITILPVSATTGDGLKEAVDWMCRYSGKFKNGEAVVHKPPEIPDEKPLLEKWLEIEDEGDEEFLEKLIQFKLESWDHRTHLRIAWLYLNKYGRREGMKLIFSGISNFIRNSERTRKTTFHETMTYFWVHMVHYAIVATYNPTKDFKGFLFSNPQLSDGGLFLEYYSKEVMLRDRLARTQVVLPDKKPLPSIVHNSVLKGVSLEVKGEEKQVIVLKKSYELSDEEFIRHFEEKKLDSWSHKSFIRVIWWFMREFEANKSSGARRTKYIDLILEKMRAHMGNDFHFTLTYFWIQMVHTAMVSNSTTKDFEGFWSQIHGSIFDIENSMLYQQYYSSQALFSEQALHEMVLPDLKEMPSAFLPKNSKKR